MCQSSAGTFEERHRAPLEMMSRTMQAQVRDDDNLENGSAANVHINAVSRGSWTLSQELVDESEWDHIGVGEGALCERRDLHDITAPVVPHGRMGDDVVSLWSMLSAWPSLRQTAGAGEQCC